MPEARQIPVAHADILLYRDWQPAGAYLRGVPTNPWTGTSLANGKSSRNAGRMRQGSRRFNRSTENSEKPSGATVARWNSRCKFESPGVPPISSARKFSKKFLASSAGLVNT